MYRFVLRPILFLFSPEFIHYFTFGLIKITSKIPFSRLLLEKLFCLNDKRLQRRVFGLEFKNPIGLAAGFDKDADLFNELASFGFGFIEIGTLTPKAQKGNLKPRLFRLPQDESLVNRMGFNNKGVESALKRLQNRNADIIIGGNIGKNKLTPNDQAFEDYKYCFDSLFEYVDYFVVNVSSPNTPGLRELQDREPLTYLLQSLQQLNSSKVSRKPLLLKIAPDLTNHQLDDIIDIALTTQIDGLIATNTTVKREGLKSPSSELDSIGNGGLSGKALRKRSTEVIRYISEKSNQQIPIIGVGGIQHPKDAVEKLSAGASLVQIYTGFVYEGPSIVKKINKGILDQL